MVTGWPTKTNLIRHLLCKKHGFQGAWPVPKYEILSISETIGQNLKRFSSNDIYSVPLQNLNTAILCGVTD